ncbi:MAG: type II 3-dehydroquinate dehydratase [Chitinophagaceae bacterium]|nr:type II 3-dehydroquinate dehydratase [Chitinophagaceae bacterium]
MEIHIVNGPNLNLLGKREPSIYGFDSFDSFFEKLQKKFSNISLVYFQSNHEGYMIDYIHKIGFTSNGIILNAGGLTHTSISLSDAISAITTPVIEVHISNIYSRENYRHNSFLTPKCKGIISGLGFSGYILAVQYFLDSE